MYIKFRNHFGRNELRDVRQLDIRSEDCLEEDGSTTHGAELYDLGFELMGGVLDAAVEYACGIMMESRVSVDDIRFRKRDAPVSVAKEYADFRPEAASLAWFNSWEAAERVMDELCRTLARGGQYFDLTVYGEDGEVKPDA